MKINKTKKASQVGFVLSFIIFVVFVFFLFVIVQPSLKTGNSQNLPENTINKIKTLALQNLTTVSVSLDKNNPKSCVELMDFFVNTGIGNKIVAHNDLENSLSLTISTSGNDLYIEKSSSDFFIKVYESEGFSQEDTGTVSGCEQFVEGSSGYTLGLIKTEEIVFASKIGTVFNNYALDYEGLKTQLGVPSGNEFGLGFQYGNGTTLSTQGPASNVNIYAYEIPVQYVNQNSNIESGFINVRTW